MSAEADDLAAKEVVSDLLEGAYAASRAIADDMFLQLSAAPDSERLISETPGYADQIIRPILEPHLAPLRLPAEIAETMRRLAVGAFAQRFAQLAAFRQSGTA